MTAIDPRTDSEIYQAIKSNLESNFSNAADKLSNFAPTSFNYIFTNAFARQQHEQEVAATSAQLSGWVNYVGKELTAEDLDELGIDGATINELNEYQDSEQLEQFAVAFGVSRDPGEYATGELDATSTTTTTLEAGTAFGTQPDENGDFLEFFVMGEPGGEFSIADEDSWNDVDFSGAETKQVVIRAEERGTEYNVGNSTVTYMPSPPSGISDVTNPLATSGGEDEQTDAELREDVKAAIIESVDGGTVDGVKGYVENNSGASSVIIDEQVTGDGEHGSYPHVHVIAFGGTDTGVEDAIEDGRPAGVEHILIRPAEIQVNVIAELTGSGIDVTAVEDAITDYFAQIDLDEPVYRDQIVQRIMNADSDISNIATLIIEINNEVLTYSAGTDVYSFDKDLASDDEDNVGITEVTGTLDGATVTFDEDVDYREWNSVAGDESEPQDSIDWSLDPNLTGAKLDDGGTFTDETAAANDATTDDMTLLPSAPAVDDAYYFGAPAEFRRFDLNVSTAGVGTYGITWEYYDGSNWVALSNVNDGTSAFTNAGTNRISWDAPSDWESTTVDGTDTYWVRARVSTFDSLSAQPLGEQAFIGYAPDDTTDFFVDYEVREDIEVSIEEIAVLNESEVTIQ